MIALGPRGVARAVACVVVAGAIGGTSSFIRRWRSIPRVRRARPICKAGYVNGHALSGARPLEEVDALVRRELAKARVDVAGGTPREAYYRVWVVEAGLPRFVRKTSFSPRPPAPWVPRALVRSAR